MKYFKMAVIGIVLVSLIPTTQAGQGSDSSYQVPKVYNPRIAVIDFDDATDLKKLEDRLLSIAKDKYIDGVLLSINHGGGKVGELSVIHDLIRRIRRDKPVVGLIRGCAYSLGYAVASATDYLIAHIGSGIGNIGVWAEYERWNENTINVKRNGYEAALKGYVFKAGKYKAIDHPYDGELTDEKKAYIQHRVNIDYQGFVECVAANRGLEVKNAAQWAEGKFFRAPEALDLKLIDEIGTALEAEAKLIALIRARNADRIISADIEYLQ